MKRREYLTGLAGVGALATVGTASVTASNHTIGSIPDTEGDDDGPGGYTYPTSDEFLDGVYDMTGVTITDEGNSWGFEVGIAGEINDPYDFDGGYGVQVFQLYVHDPNAGSAVPTLTEGREGTFVGFQQPYHYRVQAAGNEAFLETAESTAIGDSDKQTDVVSTSADPDAGSINFTVDKSAIGGGNIEDKRIALLLFGQDGFGTGNIRTAFGVENDTYQFGLGDSDVTNHPKCIDMLDPDGNQHDVLSSYTSDSLAQIPLMRVGDALEDNGMGGGMDGGMGGGMSGDLDVNGDGDADSDDVRTLLNRRKDPAFQNNPGQYDFDGDGEVDLGDVVSLFDRIFR